MLYERREHDANLPIIGVNSIRNPAESSQAPHFNWRAAPRTSDGRN
jgi:hypothetical protein